MLSYNVKILIFTFIVFLLFILSVVWWIQYKILFFPSQKFNWYPSFPYRQIFLNMDSKPVANLDPVEKFNPTSEVISVWYFNFSNNENSKTILFCHGNNGNISQRKYVIDLCHFLSVNLFLFDYRGYGNSTGIPSPDSICQDGLIAYTYLNSFCSSENIYVWGESLGGASAVHIASKKPCKRLICMSTFSSLDDIVINKSIPRWISVPSSLVIKTVCNNLSNRKKITKVKCPIVILHSETDEIIPYQCSQILYQSISHSNKIFLTIKGDHSAPEITRNQLLELINFCDFNSNFKETSHFIESWLSMLKSNVFNN